MNKIYSIIEITRPVNFLISFFSIFVAGIICSNTNYNFYNIFVISIAGAFVAASGNIINDIFDINIDKVNRPDRVLPSGRLTVFEAKLVYMFFTLLPLILSIHINLYAFAIVLFAEFSIFFYSYKFKSVPLFGNFVVSFFTGLAFIYGGTASGEPINGIIPAIFALLINFAREIIKDIEDINGDTKNGVITFPAKYGVKKSLVVTYAILIILIMSTFIPFIYEIYRIEYFVIVMMFVNTFIVYIISQLIKDQSIKTIKQSSRNLKICMILGLLAILAGKQ